MMDRFRPLNDKAFIGLNVGEDGKLRFAVNNLKVNANTFLNIMEDFIEEMQERLEKEKEASARLQHKAINAWGSND